MRPLSVTLAAIALVGTAPIFAQSQSDSAKGNTVPPEQSQAQGDAPVPAQGMLEACKKMASDKKLTGDARTKYIKECQEGKKTREGH